MTDSESRRIAVVTPVHNRRSITLQCLSSLEKIDVQGLTIEIFVVDDGSTDGTSEAIRTSHPDVQLIAGNGDLWYTEGTNVGVRAAMKTDPDYVLMINDDSLFEPRFLKNLVRTAEAHDRSVVGALLLSWDEPDRVFQVSPEWGIWSGGWRHWHDQTTSSVPTAAWEVDLIVGNCLLVPAEAIRECGLMNSSRFPNFGDAEYTPRLKRLGWTLLIAPGAHVFCQPNDVPVRVRSLGVTALAKALFWDLKHIHNVRRRYYAYVDGGPSYLAGVAAFLVFFLRILARRNLEGEFGTQQDEEPLATHFRAMVVDQQSREDTLRLKT